MPFNWFAWLYLSGGFIPARNDWPLMKSTSIGLRIYYGSGTVECSLEWTELLAAGGGCRTALFCWKWGHVCNLKSTTSHPIKRCVYRICLKNNSAKFPHDPIWKKKQRSAMAAAVSSWSKNRNRLYLGVITTPFFHFNGMHCVRELICLYDTLTDPEQKWQIEPVSRSAICLKASTILLLLLSV